MQELKKPTTEERIIFNYKVKSEELRQEFEKGNIFFNERKGLDFASEFDMDVLAIMDNPQTQKKHRLHLERLLKLEGFSFCGDIYGFNKI